MKNLNLENFGVQEMDAREMSETIGGSWFWRNLVNIGTAAVAVATAVIAIVTLSE